MKAFLTGSRVYGTVHEKSDVDLVVDVDENDFEKLMRLADNYVPGSGPEGSDYGPSYSRSLKFGRLNLICPPSDRQLAAWKIGTTNLSCGRPVTREVAIEEFKKLRVHDAVPQ